MKMKTWNKKEELIWKMVITKKELTEDDIDMLESKIDRISTVNSE